MKFRKQNRPSDQMLDAATLAQLRARDPVLLEKLFSEVNPYLARVCRANGLFEFDAEEVIFETWSRFFVNIEKFEGRSQIRTFICGILFNKIREFRRGSARVVLEDDSENFMNSAFTQEGWWKQEPGDPHKLLELRRSGEMVKECLEGLSEEQKSAFVLREVEEEASDYICNLLRIELGHLRILIFRAKEKLRKCLEGKAETP